MVRSSPPRCSISAAVRPPAGSSSRMKRGRRARPRAISRKRCSACSRRLARRWMAWPRPTPCSSSAASLAQDPVARARPTAGRRRGDEAGPAVGPAAEHGVVEHGQRCRAAAASGRCARCRARPGAGPSPGRAPRRASGSRRGRLVVARKQVQQRRLAAAVRTDQAVDLAGPQARARRRRARSAPPKRLVTPAATAGRARGCAGHLRPAAPPVARRRLGGVDAGGRCDSSPCPMARASRGRSGDTGTLDGAGAGARR